MDKVEDKPLTLKQIFELTHEELVADIAKKYLPIGEKPTRAILKFVGGVQNSGKKGWDYVNVGEEDLLLTVSDFKTKSNPTNRNQLIVTRITDSQGNNTSASTNTTSTDSDNTPKDTTASKPKSRNTAKSRIKTPNKVTSTSKAEIEALMNNVTTSTDNRFYTGFYLDQDISSFLKVLKLATEVNF